MALFVGGPFHGRDLELDTSLYEMVQLPPADRLDEFWTMIRDDPQTTVKLDWPFVYKLDRSTTPNFYRYVE